MLSKFSLTNLITVAIAPVLILAGCSDGTTSSGGIGEDASHCVERSLNTIYTNECSYNVNVIIFKAGEKAFTVKGDNASTRSSTRAGFGACRVPSLPVLNANNDGYDCS